MPSIFSSLISSLGTYVPRAFVLASFIPTLVFVILNFATLLVLSPVARAAFFPRFATLTAGFYYGMLLIAVAITAYLLSTAVTYLREILEGQHAWPRFLLEQKRAEQGAHAQGLEVTRKVSLQARAALESQRDLWTKKLGVARDLGARRQLNHAEYPASAHAHRLIGRIRESLAARTELSQQTLHEAVVALRRVLYRNDVNAPGDDGKRLLDDFRTLLAAFAGAVAFYAKAEADAFHERQFEFGQDTIAPTRIGNIAASMRDYAETRYGMDLDFFWGRIQAIAVQDAKYADDLINAKTRLDFLVLSCWLSVASTAVWAGVLAFYGYSPLQFVVVTAAGVALTYFAYELLAMSYYGFADVVRVTIDFYRLELLTRLHIQLPHSISEERALWQRLAQIAAYGQGELDLAYTL